MRDAAERLAGKIRFTAGKHDDPELSVAEIVRKMADRIAALEAENERLAAWLQRIEGRDSPCSNAWKLRQWAYQAATLGKSVEEFHQQEAKADD